ncbi:hypothetical protein OG21DRAFT_1450535 [Imleria badia]|nr:hypothetical protein OG21DRAFT_1450535 [Imleria badia]
MVQTRAAAKRLEPGDVQSNDGGMPHDTTRAVERGTGRVPSPAKKRRRDGADSESSKKTGQQCQLNLDVLFLLAAYVHPLDLLNLARTCKSLRELLMDKSSTFVWRAARRQVKGLPDCPVDLTEPEYANLLFYARCHGCGKYAKKILWKMRRRYCPACRDERLCHFSSCPEVIRLRNVLAAEQLTKGHEVTVWVEKEQADSFIREYNCSSDKERFLRDKQNQYDAIHQHARACIYWQRFQVLPEHRRDVEKRRGARAQSIIERLKQHGYEPEIAYFGVYTFQQCHKPFFKTAKPLTDKEWARMWPEWLETMTKFRSQRLDKTIHQPRRNVLVSEYVTYLASPLPDSLAFDLLPHVTHLNHFPPFRDVIYASAETQMGVKPFESAFAKLPALVAEWRKQLDVELAELVTIPSHLSSSDQAVSLSSATPMESSQKATDKLHLACAVFDTGSSVLFTHSDVFSSSMRHRTMDHGEDDSQMSFRSRFGIKALEQAPYIVHACGMDPNVATAEDMDRRNARLKCLACKNLCITWRDALYHAFHSHQYTSPRWQIISDEYIDEIEAAELPVKKELPVVWMRCLLCLPSVGDAKLKLDITSHLVSQSWHGKRCRYTRCALHVCGHGQTLYCGRDG